MSKDRLYKELSKKENLIVGAHLDCRDDFVSDSIGYADFTLNLDERLDYLSEEIEQHRFHSAHLLDIEIPKTGLSVRPGNVLPIRESVILHTIIYLIGPKLDKALLDNVYSYRIRTDWKKRAKDKKSIFKQGADDFPFLKRKTIKEFDSFDSWYELWPKFEEKAHIAVITEGYEYLTKTDITAYFENIDLTILEAQLRERLPDENAIIQILMRIFYSWTRETSMGAPICRGLPQGNDVSSVLANIFLIPLDNALKIFAKKNDAVLMRYVDDVKVFTKSIKNARDIVFIINESLRQLHLNLQGAKTQILFGSDLNYEIDNKEFVQIDCAISAIEEINKSKKDKQRLITAELSKIRPLTSKFRSNLPNSIKKIYWKQNRLLRRLFTVYSFTGRRWMLNTAIYSLRELPDIRILNKALSYLTCLPYKDHDYIVEELFKILDEDLLPFPYQNSKLIEAIKFLHPSNCNQIATWIRKYALINKKTDWTIKQKAIEALITLPYQDRYSYSIALRYLNDEHPFVRRAAVALLVRGPEKEVRPKLKELIHHPDIEISKMVLYWNKILEDREFVRKTFSRFHHNINDRSIVRFLSTLYCANCAEDQTIANHVWDESIEICKSKSVKLQWHGKKLKKESDWGAI